MTTREISIGGNADRNLIIAGNGNVIHIGKKEIQHPETETNIYFP